MKHNDYRAFENERDDLHQRQAMAQPMIADNLLCDEVVPLIPLPESTFSDAYRAITNQARFWAILATLFTEDEITYMKEKLGC